MCDLRHNIIKHVGEEDEEDLEILRSAALKSLQNKKEPITLQYNNERIPNYKTHNKSVIGKNSLYSSSNRIDQQYIPKQHQISPNNYKTLNENYFGVNNNQRPPYRHIIDGNNTIRPVNQNNLENYGVEKLNINEPYIPHCLPTGPGHSTIHSAVNTNWLTESTTIGNGNHIRHGFHSTMPYVAPLPSKALGIHESVSGSLSNVQLSPRSLAFVEQNNDILARRKVGNLSPISYNRSPRRSKSPDYRRAIESSIYKANSPNYSPTSTSTYRPPSPSYSPDFYKSTSPRRWSVSPHNYKKAISRSPPLQSNQISRQRSPGFIRKRTISRSPQRYSSRSPHSSGLAKQRTRSRSPTITIIPNIKHRSPPIMLSSIRRYSRSPIPINERHDRKTSRSPKGINSRHCSPYSSRYPVTKNRSPALNHNKKRSPNGGSHSDSINDTRQKRIHSPIQSSSINAHGQHQNKNYNKRKSSSPLNHQQQIQRNRSRTPQPSSPLRKYNRRSRDGNVGGHITEQERNRNKRSPINKRRRGADTNGASRNRNNNMRHNMRRSQSPNGLPHFNNYNNNRKRRSRSRNIEKLKRYDGKDNYDRRRTDRNGTEYKKRENNYEKDIDEKQSRNINKNDNNASDKTIKSDNKLIKKDDANENFNLEITHKNVIGSSDITSLTPPLRNIGENINIIEKINQHKNVKEKSDNDYDISNENGDNKMNASENEDEDDDDDGIYLFPSDDSESETEGRFKSSSNRNERKTNVPTLSFAKLNSSSVPDVIKDLQDVCNTKNSKGGDNRFDRRRDDRSKKNLNIRHNRNDKRRYNDIRNRKNSRSRSADRKNRDEISGKYDRRDIDIDDKRKNIEKSMFKSTFQAIDNEGNKINPKNNSKAVKSSSLGKLNNNENHKKRFKDSEDSLENCNNNNQQKLKSHTLKRSLKTSTPPIINMDKYKSAKGGDAIENEIINIRSLTPISTISNNCDGTINGKKSVHSRLGAMTNTFKSAKKSSTWTKTGSSLTPPPLPSSSSSFSDKVSIFSIF